MESFVIACGNSLLSKLVLISSFPLAQSPEGAQFSVHKQKLPQVDFQAILSLLVVASCSFYVWECDGYHIGVDIIMKKKKYDLWRIMSSSEAYKMKVFVRSRPFTIRAIYLPHYRDVENKDSACFMRSNNQFFRVSDFPLWYVVPGWIMREEYDILRLRRCHFSNAD
ncbi:hypothetical protein AKJ16_DCAP20861 [Drosera capensis]